MQLRPTMFGSLGGAVLTSRRVWPRGEMEEPQVFCVCSLAKARGWVYMDSGAPRGEVALEYAD